MGHPGPRPLTGRAPAPTPPTCISRTCRCREGETVMDHVEIEIGLGRFEAVTIIGPRHDSSVHESVAAALVWLSGRFIASVMSTEVEVLNCTAAIFDVDAEEVMVQWHGSSDELADLLDRLAK